MHLVWGPGIVSLYVHLFLYNGWLVHNVMSIITLCCPYYQFANCHVCQYLVDIMLNGVALNIMCHIAS